MSAIGGGSGSPTRVVRATAGLTPAMFMMEAMVSAGRTEASCTGRCGDGLAEIEAVEVESRDARLERSPSGQVPLCSIIRGCEPLLSEETPLNLAIFGLTRPLFCAGDRGRRKLAAPPAVDEQHTIHCRRTSRSELVTRGDLGIVVVASFIRGSPALLNPRRSARKTHVANHMASCISAAAAAAAPVTSLRARAGRARTGARSRSAVVMASVQEPVRAPAHPPADPALF